VSFGHRAKKKKKKKNQKNQTKFIFYYLFLFQKTVSAVRTILAGVSVLNAVAAIEFYLMDATFLLAFGIDAARATPQVQFLCASLSSLYAAQAALLFCAAVMLDMHGRRAVGWATCGANLLLAENVLRLREMFHSSNHAGVDASRLSLGLALVVHVACAIALVAAVLLDLNSGGAGSSSGQSVSFDVPDAPAGAKFDPNAPLPPATGPDGKPTGVDWRTFKATTFPGDANPAAGASTSSASNKKNK
jgi:hypothetical protein